MQEGMDNMEYSLESAFARLSFPSQSLEGPEIRRPAKLTQLMAGMLSADFKSDPQAELSVILAPGPSTLTKP